MRNKKRDSNELNDFFPYHLNYFLEDLNTHTHTHIN